MTEQSQSCNLRALRELLIAAFDTEELRALISYDDTLSSLAAEFAPLHPITAMVDETISWCGRRVLIPYLVQRIEEERPEQYRRFEPELFITDIEQPGEKETAKALPETRTITGPISLRLVRVPAGEFLMGSDVTRDEYARDDEFPSHRVYVPEFHIGQYPVTQLQYQAFGKATEREALRHSKSHEIPDGRGNHPADMVSWRDAIAFCAWLSEETGQPFRLPTEAEWEKAARGADGRIWPWGDGLPNNSRCNFGFRVSGTTPIGRYSPQGDSPYGCADMAGNVAEWCSTAYEAYPYEDSDGRELVPVDISSQSECRVLRGGDSSDGPGLVRCACRSWAYRGSVINIMRGFRVATVSLK